MQRILVTGGAGFIGSHTVDLLLAQGLQVVVLDNLASGHLANLDLAHPQLSFVNGDILDFPLLLSLVQKSDAVLHLAALPSVPKSIEDPVGSLKINMEGFINVLQAIRQTDRPIRLVYASSAAVYGDSVVLPCNDEMGLPESVLSPYALEKANNERYARLYEQLFGVKSLGLRYFNVYGLRQDPASPYSGVISRFIENYQQNVPITIFGEGKQSRDFIHVSDVARANWLALQNNYCGALNIATGIPETLLHLVSYLETAGKRKASLNFAPARVGDIQQSWAATEKAAGALSFRYQVSLEQGIHSWLEIVYD